MTRPILIDVPGIGELRLLGSGSVPPGWHTGRCWTNAELAMLASVAPTQEEARAIADIKAAVEGRVIGAAMGSQEAREQMPASLPSSTPTQRTKRFIDRGHGPRPVSPNSGAVARAMKS